MSIITIIKEFVPHVWVGFIGLGLLYRNANIDNELKYIKNDISLLQYEIIKDIK
jgi:hypothetical protein